MAIVNRLLSHGILWLLIAPTVVWAETSEKWQTLLQLDNDLFSGSDRDYTNGVRLGFVQELSLDSAAGKRIYDRLEAGADTLNQYRFQTIRIPPEDEIRFAKGFGLTQLMFTPDDPEAESAPRGQRPYAGWLGLEYSLHVKSRNFVNSVTWTLGTTGKRSYAQEAQNWVHRNISNSPIYQGWGSQVPSELTVNVHFDHKQRFRKIPSLTRGDIQLDGYYEAGLALGNYRTSAYLGALGRVGYRLPASFFTPRVQVGSFGHQLFGAPSISPKKFSALAFLGLRGTGTLHDITLDGPVFREFDTGVKSKPFEAELITGFGFRYRNVDLVLSQTIRSDEFNGQSDNQQFGSIMMRFQSGL